MKYPDVLDEFAALEELIKGSSICRLGDGEFKLIDGKGYVREPANPLLAKELRNAVARPAASCIVGIPRLDKTGPKNDNWIARIHRYIPHLNPDLTYYSAFISRPDSAPRINTKAFAKRLQQLWLDRHVVAVCEPTSSLRRMLDHGAAKVTHIECPSFNAYALIDLLAKAVVEVKPQVAFLSCGVTATCLANRLARKGIQTIDFGSGGAFVAKLLKG